MKSGEVAPVYFADENLLGLGKLLHRSGRNDILYPGHDDFVEVPLGAADLEWMPVVGGRGLIVLTRDRRTRTRPAELRAYKQYEIRSVWFGAKRDLGPNDQLQLFLDYEARLRSEIARLGAGPWALALSSSGLREMSLRSGE